VNIAPIKSIDATTIRLFIIVSRFKEPTSETVFPSLRQVPLFPRVPRSSCFPEGTALKRFFARVKLRMLFCLLHDPKSSGHYSDGDQLQANSLHCLWIYRFSATT